MLPGSTLNGELCRLGTTCNGLNYIFRKTRITCKFTSIPICSGNHNLPYLEAISAASVSAFISIRASTTFFQVQLGSRSIQRSSISLRQSSVVSFSWWISSRSDSGRPSRWPRCCHSITCCSSLNRSFKPVHKIMKWSGLGEANTFGKTEILSPPPFIMK